MARRRWKAARRAEMNMLLLADRGEPKALKEFFASLKE